MLKSRIDVLRAEVPADHQPPVLYDIQQEDFRLVTQADVDTLLKRAAEAVLRK